MPKRAKKLLVYLDQNFISEMAKARDNERVKQEFREIYELLHTGFLEEKLVVPQSWFHDLETSLAPPLKERIVSYQNYLGQVELRRPDEVSNAQIAAALQRFLGDRGTDAFGIETAFLRHPDQRVRQVNITVDRRLELRDYKTGRSRTEKALEALRQRRLQERTTYEAQLENEYNDHRDFFRKNALQGFAHLCEHRRDDLLSFANSDDFKAIPVISIAARLYAAILTNATRQIQSGDATDIDIFSTYVPYIDVLCTDTFMAAQLRTLEIDKEYQVAIYSAKTASLNDFKTFLEDYLKNTAPIRRPAITVFVLPSQSIKEHAFEFFRDLGAAAGEFGTSEYVEIYAFDDGLMPQYEFRQLPNQPVPFYGIQEIHPIKLPPGTSNEKILRLCREHCQSDRFVLIDEWKKLPEHFLLGAAMRADAGEETTDGNRIYTKNP